MNAEMMKSRTKKFVARRDLLMLLGQRLLESSISKRHILRAEVAVGCQTSRLQDLAVYIQIIDELKSKL